MRISTRLNFMAAAAGAGFFVMGLALLWSFQSLEDAKADYRLANELKTGFLVRASIRDQYHLYREARLVRLWGENKAETDRMLLRAQGLVHDATDERHLQVLRHSLGETASIFQRLVANTERSSGPGANAVISEELDKRLYSQLLLKAGILRDAIMALEESSAQRVERAYRNLALLVGLFAVGLALVFLFTAMQVVRFLRRGLEPLHAGARAVAAGDLSYRLEAGGSDELAELARSINAMTERTEAFTRNLEAEIHEKKQLEEQLQQVLREQEIILAHANVGISLIIDRKQVWLNDWMVTTFQYTREEQEGQTTRRRYASQENYDQLGREAYAAISTGGYFQTVQKLVRKDGQPLWIHYNGQAVDPSDLSRGTLWILTDVTDKKLAEDALREGEAQYRSLFELSPDAICLIRMKDKQLLEVNPVWEQMFGCSRQEALGRTTMELGLRADSTARSDFYRNLETEKRLPIQRAMLCRRNGASFEAQFAASLINLAGEPVAILVLRDMTDEFALRADLEREELRYAKVMATTKDAIHVIDQAGHLREWNPAFLEHLGYTDEEARSLSVFDWDARLTAAEVPGIINSILESPRSFETLHQRKDGSIRNVEITASGILLEGEQMLLATARDITDRKQAEAALQEALERLTKIASRVPGVVYQYRLRPDGTSCFPFASEALKDIYRVSPEEVREDATKVFAAIHPEDLAALAASIQASARDLTPWQYEYRVKSPDGTTRSVLGNAIPQRESDGSVLWHGFITEITGRKLAEQALQESEARFRSLFELNQAPQLIIDPDTGHILDANLAAASFYGHSLEHLRTRLISDLNIMTPEEIHLEMEQARRLDMGHFQFRHRLADGRIRDVEVYSSPIPLGVQTVLFSIIHDITDRKLAEEALRQLNQTLEQRVATELAHRLDQERMLVHQSRLAAMGEMVANIAHQWRQPLNALAMVQANLSDAHRYKDLTDEYLLDSLHQSKLLVQKMSMTIKDFLDFFRPDKAPVRFTLNHQAREAIKLVLPGLKHHHVSVDLQEGEEVWALGHPNEFSQVLLNLFSNARDAIQSSGAPEGLIRLVISREGGLACLRFSDNGGGIDPKAIERIFEPYYTDKTTGTGLGLYMSRMIMEQSLGGTIQAENLPGGALFTLHLPLAEQNHDPNLV